MTFQTQKDRQTYGQTKSQMDRQKDRRRETSQTEQQALSRLKHPCSLLAREKGVGDALSQHQQRQKYNTPAAPAAAAAAVASS